MDIHFLSLYINKMEDLPCVISRNMKKQLSRISCRDCCRIAMPPIVLVRVAIVGDASDDQTREIIQGTGCFHLKT
jgi:hypothetical protein